MLCQNCGKYEATTHVKRIINGESAEAHLYGERLLQSRTQDHRQGHHGTQHRREQSVAEALCRTR